MRTNLERKTFNSMGPWHIYAKLAMLTFYRPDLWRKVCKMLCQMRRMNRIDFTGEGYRRMQKYARQAFKDTKLPFMIRRSLANCISVEFKFEVDPQRATEFTIKG